MPIKKIVKEIGKNIISSKWVYRKKSEPDGSICYKSRIVLNGFMQIPGIDYTECFSPVATDTTTHLILALTLLFDWACESADIKAAFLEGDATTDMFMEWPPGLVELGIIDEATKLRLCIKLVKSIYGNVDAALCFYMTYAKYLLARLNII